MQQTSNAGSVNAHAASRTLDTQLIRRQIAFSLIRWRIFTNRGETRKCRDASRLLWRSSTNPTTRLRSSIGYGLPIAVLPSTAVNRQSSATRIPESGRERLALALVAIGWVAEDELGAGIGFVPIVFGQERAAWRASHGSRSARRTQSRCWALGGAARRAISHGAATAPHLPQNCAGKSAWQWVGRTFFERHYGAMTSCFKCELAGASHSMKMAIGKYEVATSQTDCRRLLPVSRLGRRQRQLFWFGGRPRAAGPQTTSVASPCGTFSSSQTKGVAAIG